MHVAGGRRGERVRRDRGDDDEVQLVPGSTFRPGRAASRAALVARVAGVFAFGRDAAGERMPVRVAIHSSVGIDELFEVGIGDDFFRNVAAGSGDANLAGLAPADRRWIGGEFFAHLRRLLKNYETKNPSDSLVANLRLRRGGHVTAPSCCGPFDLLAALLDRLRGRPPLPPRRLASKQNNSQFFIPYLFNSLVSVAGVIFRNLILDVAIHFLADRPRLATLDSVLDRARRTGAVADNGDAVDAEQWDCRRTFRSCHAGHGRLESALGEQSHPNWRMAEFMISFFNHLNMIFAVASQVFSMTLPVNPSQTTTSSSVSKRS